LEGLNSVCLDFEEGPDATGKLTMGSKRGLGGLVDVNN